MPGTKPTKPGTWHGDLVTNFVNKTYYSVIDDQRYKCTKGWVKLSYCVTDTINKNTLGYYFCDPDDVINWSRVFPHGMVFTVRIPCYATVRKYSNKYITNQMTISDPMEFKDWYAEHQNLNLNHKLTEQSDTDVPDKYAWHRLKDIENQTRELCIQAIEHDYRSIQHIRDLSKYPEVLDHAIKINGLALQYIDTVQQTYQRRVMAVTQNGLALQHMVMQTYELCILAIKQNPHALKHVIRQTADMCLLAVKSLGLTLQHVNPGYLTPDLCLEAVRQNGLAIRYIPVDIQTNQMYEEAVNNCPFAIKYIVILTETLCLIAVKKDGFILRHIDPIYQTKIICLEAVKQNGLALQFVDPGINDHMIRAEAVKQNCLASKYIEHQIH
jgi:hypothetical protein